MEAEVKETVYGTQDDTHVMSEHVRSLAANIYREFERLIRVYDENVVKDLMPLVVAILESLDQSCQERQDLEVEMDLLREDNEQLLTQYEREKQLRKSAEQKYLEFEDVAEDERKQLQDKLESLESIVRMFEIKMKNAQEQISRLEDRDADTKKEFAKLHERYTDLFKAHVDYKERTRILSSADRSFDVGDVQLRRGSPNLMFAIPNIASVPFGHAEPLMGRHSTADNRFSSLHFEEMPESQPATASSLQHELKRTELLRADRDSPRSSGRPCSGGEDLVTSTPVASSTRSSVLDIGPSDVSFLADSGAQTVTTETTLENGKPDNKMDSGMADITPTIEQEAAACDEVDDPTDGSVRRPIHSLYDELSTLDNDALGHMDYGADIVGMSREVENLIQENNELLATKNALNVVKDDLIARVDELTSEKDILREEINSLEIVKERFCARISELEKEVTRLKDALEQKPAGKATTPDDEEMIQKKRFTRVEMARVLLERNQYKERLMELQEAVRWTEMIRASRDNPGLVVSGKKKSSMWNFFSNLFTPTNKPLKKPDSAVPALAYRTSSARGSGVRPVGDPNRPHRERRVGSETGGTGAPRAFDFLQDDILADRARHQREQERKMRLRQQTRATALQRDDGRLQAYGWSLPAKFGTLATIDGSIAGATKSAPHIAVPVPVYCRPVSDDCGIKLWCAASVNLAGGKTRDGGSVVGTSVFYKNIFDAARVSTLSAIETPPNDEVERLNQELEQQEKDLKELEVTQQTSSLVWICTTTAHGDGQVTVIDANSPGDVLDSFRVSSSKILCIASVPGATEPDFPAEDGDVLNAGVDEHTCEIPRDGLTSPVDDPGIGRMTFVRCTIGCEPTSETSSLDADKSSLEHDARLTTAEDLQKSLVTGMNSASQTDGSPTDSPTRAAGTGRSSRRFLQTANADVVKDGMSSLTGCDELIINEMSRVTTLLPTMWLGTHSGRLYVHSAVAHWKKCIYCVTLPAAIVAISHVKGRVFVALANGSIAAFCRAPSGLWELSSYHVISLGEPNISVRCLTVVANQRLWAGHRNCIHIIDPKTLQVENSFDAHPRQESQVRHMVWVGEGVWVSIRLDSTLRLYHAYTHQHLQDVDVEPYVSKLLGAGKLGFSFVRISSLTASCNRLWVGTGNGVIISVPLSETVDAGILTSVSACESSRKPSPTVPTSTGSKPGGVIRVYGNVRTDVVFPGSFIPYCNITQAQLSFHGHKDAIKFFVAVPGQPTSYLSGFGSQGVSAKDGLSGDPKAPGKSAACLQKTVLVMSGGEGYVDFRLGEVEEDEAAADGEEQKSTSLLKAERSHLIVWQVFTDS